MSELSTIPALLERHDFEEVAQLIGRLIWWGTPVSPSVPATRETRHDGVCILSADMGAGHWNCNGYVWWTSQKVDPIVAQFPTTPNGIYRVRWGSRVQAPVTKAELELRWRKGSHGREPWYREFGGLLQHDGLELVSMQGKLILSLAALSSFIESSQSRSTQAGEIIEHLWAFVGADTAGPADFQAWEQSKPPAVENLFRNQTIPSCPAALSTALRLAVELVYANLFTTADHETGLQNTLRIFEALGYHRPTSSELRQVSISRRIDGDWGAKLGRHQFTEWKTLRLQDREQ